MLYALIKTEKREAFPGSRGVCPSCGEDVIGRCGEVNAWHWAHETICPFDNEPETAWHIQCKSLFPRECVEIKEGDHRADVIWRGHVYEFQSKPMDPKDMEERQNFWESKGYRFVWVFNMSESEENFVKKYFEKHVTFRWKWPKRRLENIKLPFIFFFSFGCINIKRLYWGERVSGWGHPIELENLAL